MIQPPCVRRVACSLRSLNHRGRPRPLSTAQLIRCGLGYGNSYSSSYPSSSLYRPYYNEYSYPIQYSSSYSNGLSRSSPWYSQNTGYGNGYAQYGMGNNYGSMYDNNGYNPLLLNVNQHSSPLEQTSYLNMIHDKENFQLPEGDPQFLMDMAEERNWGYSVLFVNDTDEVTGGLAEATSRIPSSNVMPIYGLNCYSLLKYDTVVISRKALDILESRLLTHMHRTTPLNNKYKYKDIKEKIMREGEVEEHPTMAPVV